MHATEQFTLQSTLQSTARSTEQSTARSTEQSRPALERATAQEISDRLGGKKQGQGFSARCPCHDDKHASLSIADGEKGILLYCHAGCKFEDVRDALGLAPERAVNGRQLVAVYPYTDAEGKLLYEVLRYQLPDGSKDFRQRPANWQALGKWSMDGIQAVPFNLPGVLRCIKDDGMIYFVEGEKDAQTLIKHGLCATTNHGGARNTRAIQEIAPYFKGADVVIVPDNDEAGILHAMDVQSALARTANWVGMSEVEEPYKDVTEWVEGQGPNAAEMVIFNQRDWEAYADYRWKFLKIPPVSIFTSRKHNGRYALLTFEQIETLPPVGYLDEHGELVGHGLNVMYARRGAGKSFVALDYSLSIAQTSPVVYVAGEGVSGYPDRIAAWLNHHDKAAQHFRFVENAVPLLKPEEVDNFIYSASKIKPVLIVLDTLARCMAGGDESKTADMSRIVEACDLIRAKTGAALLIIHHTGKVENGTRGSIVLEDAADMVISLVNDEGVIKLSCTKAKDSRPFEPRYLQLVEMDAREGQRSCVVLPSEKVVQAESPKLKPSQRKLLEALASEQFKEGGATLAEMYQFAEVSKATAAREVSELVERGYVQHVNKGDPYLLTPLGQSKLQE